MRPPDDPKQYCSIDRRSFLKYASVAVASLTLPREPFGSRKKSLLVFTKSSGFEHAVVKTTNGQPSIVDNAIAALGKNYGFEVTPSKNGRIFDSKEFHAFGAVLFYTSGSLTAVGKDGNPAMTEKGKQTLLDAISDGMGFVGVHASTDSFHTLPDPDDRSNRYLAHGDKSDPFVRMQGGEFIIHGSTPRLQAAHVIVNDPKFPGLEGVSSPVNFIEEWYSLKDFMPDLHVILTLDTHGMTGAPYQRPPYPVTWARMQKKGRVFYTAIGDRPEDWTDSFFLNLLAGGIRWALGDAKASLTKNLEQAAPGYAVIPPKGS
jgi:type 1 glutamine amidotransferase